MPTLISIVLLLPPQSWDILSKNDKGSDPLDPNPPEQVHLTSKSPDTLNELFIQVTPISKLYTDDTGNFPIHTHSGNKYIIIAYHCDANLIPAEPFTSRKYKHLLLAYEKLM